ncbi:uncharacterized protein [Dasypus novemcinctus]|uniref:uncharacterized protein n=1 Tax=Dasypus novemcinctus TaxID=9361 RepID=UPI0039C9E6B0
MGRSQLAGSPSPLAVSPRPRALGSRGRRERSVRPRPRAAASPGRCAALPCSPRRDAGPRASGATSPTSHRPGAETIPELMASRAGPGPPASPLPPNLRDTPPRHSPASSPARPKPCAPGVGAARAAFPPAHPLRPQTLALHTPCTLRARPQAPSQRLPVPLGRPGRSSGAPGSRAPRILLLALLGQPQHLRGPPPAPSWLRPEAPTADAELGPLGLPAPACTSPSPRPARHRLPGARQTPRLTRAKPPAPARLLRLHQGSPQDSDGLARSAEAAALGRAFSEYRLASGPVGCARSLGRPGHSQTL